MTSQKTSKKIQISSIGGQRPGQKKISWLNIADAGKPELEYLRKKYNFDLIHLHASSSQVYNPRPQVTESSNYIFIILHFPVLKNGAVFPGEMEFFVTQDSLITLHNNNIGALNDFFNLSKKDPSSLLTAEKTTMSTLIYELLEKLILSCFPLLDHNSKAINEMEEVIFAQRQKEAVSQILLMRHNITNLRKILQNHKNILKSLVVMENDLFPGENKSEYFKLIAHTKNIWEILENQKEIVEMLNSTNESLLNYRLSDIMKTLTIFSVIVFPLTLLAAIFGMNTVNGMPFVENEHGFWIILGIMLMGSLGMLLFFEKKKWL